MENEVAIQQAKDGEGVLTMSAGIPNMALKDIKTIDLQGEYASLDDVINGLITLKKTLGRMNPHPVHLSAVVIEKRQVIDLVASIARVPGQQATLAFGGTLEQEAKAEAAVGMQAAKIAAQIAKEIREDKDFYAEDLEERLAKSKAPKLTIEALLATRPDAAQIFGSTGALPPMNGQKLPKSLPSKKLHKLLVSVQGGVNSMTGEVVVGLVKVVDSNTIFTSRTGSRGILKLKVPVALQQRYFAAAQCAQKNVEVDLSAMIPLHTDLRRCDLDLQLAKISSQETYRNLLEMALAQEELDL